uniref:Uncharacterized protein n=1 Tax=Arundo donax TaxID=35708 RepID=A0A0A8YZC6_ARUDO
MTSKLTSASEREEEGGGCAPVGCVVIRGGCPGWGIYSGFCGPPPRGGTGVAVSSRAR